MAAVTRFEDLECWRKARELTAAVFECCSVPAMKRQFVLRDQLTRAAISVGANIAEGFGRKSDADFARFLDMARGSATEVQSLLYTMQDFRLLDDEGFKSLYTLADSCIALIAGMTRYLRGKKQTGS